MRLEEEFRLRRAESVRRSRVAREPRVVVRLDDYRHRQAAVPYGGDRRVWHDVYDAAMLRGADPDEAVLCADHAYWPEGELGYPPELIADKVSPWPAATGSAIMVMWRSASGKLTKWHALQQAPPMLFSNDSPEGDLVYTTRCSLRVPKRSVVGSERVDGCHVVGRSTLGMPVCGLCSYELRPEFVVPKGMGFVEDALDQALAYTHLMSEAHLEA